MSAPVRAGGDRPSDAVEPPEGTTDVTPDEPVRADLEAIAAASVGATAPRAPAPTLPLGLARALSVVEGGVAIATAGGPTVARIDPSVHPAVVESACSRGEMLLVTSDERGEVTVVGALRTQPTPGLDAMDEIRLEARRIELVGGEEIQLRSGVAALALRAVGEVETYADRIVSRAEEVQKIIGRMLRLN